MNRWLRGLVLALLSSLACASTSVAQNAQDVAALNAEVARLYRAGKYDEALPLAQQVLALREKLQEPRDVVESLNNVAELNRALGRYSIAEQFFKRSLAVIEKSLAPGDPFVGASLSNLAGLYREQGRFGEAEQLVKRSLMLAETNLGADHPDIAEPLGYLAVLYLAQGRFGEALPSSWSRRRSASWPRTRASAAAKRSAAPCWP